MLQLLQRSPSANESYTEITPSTTATYEEIDA